MTKSLLFVAISLLIGSGSIALAGNLSDQDMTGTFMIADQSSYDNQGNFSLNILAKSAHFSGRLLGENLQCQGRSAYDESSTEIVLTMNCEVKDDNDVLLRSEEGHLYIDLSKADETLFKNHGLVNAQVTYFTRKISSNEGWGNAKLVKEVDLKKLH